MTFITRHPIASRVLPLLAAWHASGALHADFTGYAVMSRSQGKLVKHEVFAMFDGPTDTLLNAFHIALVSGGQAYHHADALTGGVDSTVAGTWNPQFVLVPGAFDSYACVGGGEGFASGNSTASDPDWGAAGFNTAQIPYGDGTFGPGWFNQNPPNLQGRVSSCGIVRIGQFVTSASGSVEFFIKVGYVNGQGGGVQFGEGTVNLAGGDANDCNANGVLDLCDIRAGSESDDDLDGTPDSCQGPLGDLNGDGIVTASDFALLLTAWGATGPNPADLNDDGVVNAADATLLLDNWGATG
jgi:hypothetical protein